MTTWNKVIYKEIRDGIVFYYGLGRYIGEFVPEFDLFKKHGLKCSCFLLNNGKYAWSFNTNAIDVDQVRDHRFYKLKLDDNILPVVNHLLYDDYTIYKKMKRTFTHDAVYDLIKNNKIKNITFHD